MVFGLTITVMLPLLWAAFTPPALPHHSDPLAPESTEPGSSELERTSPNEAASQSIETDVGTGIATPPASDTIDANPEQASAPTVPATGAANEREEPIPPTPLEESAARLLEPAGSPSATAAQPEPAEPPSASSAQPEPAGASSASAAVPPAGIEAKRPVESSSGRRKKGAQRTANPGSSAKGHQAQRTRAGWVQIMRDAGWLGNRQRP
jgi:hypothetical protein